MDAQPLVVPILAAIASLVALVTILRRKGRDSVFFPGPPRHWLLGNALSMPKTREWLTFAEWGRLYGPIVSLEVFGQRFILLNAIEEVNEIMEKQSAINSDRPHLEMAGGLVLWEKTLALLPYGPRFRETRKFFHQTIGGHAVHKWKPLVQQSAVKMILATLDAPSNLIHHIRHATGGVILKITYGYDVQDSNDPLVNIAEAAVEGFSQASVPGAWLVDIFPALRYVPDWMPGATFKVKAAQWRDAHTQLLNVPFNMVEEQMTRGKARPSFLKELLEDADVCSDPEKVDIVKWSAASLYAAASNTTVSVMSSFFLAMSLYPEVQAHAQAEMDRVVGQGRLPSWDDHDSLPYLESLVKEVLRWNPVAPLGFPHRSTQEQVFEGQRIPEGTVFIANIWSILHNEDVYSDPLKFDPARYLGDQGPGVNSPAFGFGRRVCPGRDLAYNTIWITFAQSIATLEIHKAVDLNGQEINPSLEYTSGTISHPPPFQCRIKARTVIARELLEKRDLNLLMEIEEMQ